MITSAFAMWPERILGDWLRMTSVGMGKMMTTTIGIDVAISRALLADRSMSRFGLSGSTESFIRIFRTTRYGVDFATDQPTLHDRWVTCLAQE